MLYWLFLTLIIDDNVLPDFDVAAVPSVAPKFIRMHLSLGCPFPVCHVKTAPIRELLLNLFIRNMFHFHSCHETFSFLQNQKVLSASLLQTQVAQSQSVVGAPMQLRE